MRALALATILAIFVIIVSHERIKFGEVEKNDSAILNQTHETIVSNAKKVAPKEIAKVKSSGNLDFGENQSTQDPSEHLVTKYNLTPGLDLTEYKVQDYYKLRPWAKKLADGMLSVQEQKNITVVHEVTSKKDEPNVNFSSLTTSCPVLDTLTIPVVLRFDNNGTLTERTFEFRSRKCSSNSL